MKKETAFWTDHKQAVMVMTLNQAQGMTRAESKMERDFRFLDEALNPYYDAVNPALDDTSSILMLEPVEARLNVKNPIMGKDPMSLFFLSNQPKQ